MNIKSFLNRVAVIAGLTVGAFAISVLATGTWTPPQSAPPIPNVDSPVLSKGYTAQTFSNGLLGLSALVFNPNPGNAVPDGKILTSSGNNGTVVWGDLPSLKSTKYYGYVDGMTAGGEASGSGQGGANCPDTGEYVKSVFVSLTDQVTVTCAHPWYYYYLFSF